MRNVRDYAVVTAAYWAFTLTDGALRMLVLLHLNGLGYTPLAIASLFLFYEFFGVVTNLVGGWLGARVGLKATLFSGLALQVLACGMLAADPRLLTIPYVMVAQGLSGVAKDLTKMSSKSYIRLVVPEHDRGGLLKWVALLTGSKNTLKGAGFFLGAALLGLVGFRGACGAMAAGLVVALVASVAMLPRAPGKAATKVGLRAMIATDRRIHLLSAARFFLFGARDVWFVLALPIFLAVDLGWSFAGVGGFLALWIVGYGIVQAAAPALLGRRRGPPDAGRLGAWTALLAPPLVALLLLLHGDVAPGPTLIGGLFVFGLVFAFNSAIHSYLIVHYAERGRVSLAVGFYYMANAAGRLVGTVLGGAVFQAAGEGRRGLVACIAAALALVLASRAFCGPLRRAELSLDAPAATG